MNALLEQNSFAYSGTYCALLHVSEILMDHYYYHLLKNSFKGSCSDAIIKLYPLLPIQCHFQYFVLVVVKSHGRES